MRLTEDEGAQREKHKQRVEYYIPSVIDLPNYQTNVFQDALNKIASQGWRLLLVHQGQYIFERDV